MRVCVLMIMLTSLCIPIVAKCDLYLLFSTYSNLYNHPTKIVEPSDPLKKQIKLSKKTGIPLEVVPGPVPKEVLTEPSTKKGNNITLLLSMHIYRCHLIGYLLHIC